MSAAASSLRTAIQEVVDALARCDFEEPAAAYTLVGLVPIDGSATVCAAWEWEYSALCLELLPASLVLELRRRLPSLPWALAVVPPSNEEVPPSAEELPLVEEPEEVVTPVATHMAKGKGKAKAVEESRPEKVPRLRTKKSPQQIEVGPRNEWPCDHSLVKRVLAFCGRLRVDAERHLVPSGSRARVRRMRVEIVDEGENAPPSSPEVAPQSPSGSSGGGLPALDTAVTATRPRSRRMVPAVDNAEVGPSTSTLVGEKRPRDEAEGLPPFKHVRFQVPVRCLTPMTPLNSLAWWCRYRPSLLLLPPLLLHPKIALCRTWVAAQQYENQAFCRALDAQATEFREMVAALTRTIDQDRSSTARELQRGRLFRSTAYPTLHLAERYFLDHPSACASPLEDYPVYGRADETEEHSEAACDHEPAGEDGREDFGKWCEEEEAEEEGWGLNDDERDSAESTDRGSCGEPEDAEREDSGDECDRALVVDEDESDDSSSSVDLSEEEANALIANVCAHWLNGVPSSPGL
ncbi:hypothetical protein NEOLEDRAFT_1180370 [Neolentinus lepideus HHB14362 ss-1]|uniref:Uncharacterized protein n=1 Tax=Neolentinus lepideus HHB14362 ss-1 TaxID=1314782 RepID=A0A165R129_9AGAM|nr:hypothetical protein NEOLEDRAFT_1180370 [Neolentinus lepideus HHB14362 ss-1]